MSGKTVQTDRQMDGTTDEKRPRKPSPSASLGRVLLGRHVLVAERYST
jgi:hypothetical protein